MEVKKQVEYTFILVGEKIIRDASHIFLHRSHHFLAQLLHARGKGGVALDRLQKHLRNVWQ